MLGRRRLWPRVGAIALASTAFTPVLSLAQSAPAPAAVTPGTSAAELDPNARAPKPPARAAGGAFAPEPPGPCPLSESPLQVSLSSVTFKGSTAVGDARLRAAYAEYLGKPQPVAVICTIRDRVSRIIFDSGVLARVEIPEQRISGGALQLEVIEAHVVNVRVRGDVGPVQAAIERYAEKLRGMRPFDMNKAQRYLLLASDVPGVTARAAIRPSTSPERGAVDIDITVTREKPDLFVNVQNTGSPQVGRWGGLARADIAGFTAWGDQTTLTVFTTADAREQWLAQLGESARFGADGFVTRGTITVGRSRPGEVLRPLGLKSDSLVGNLEAAYPLVRERTQNLNLAGGLDVIDQKTEAAGVGRISRDKLRVAYARADGDYRTEIAQHPVLASAAFQVRKGVSLLGASREGQTFLTRAVANPQAWVIRGSGGLDILLADRLTGQFRGQAQYSSSTLLPYEQVSVGGLTVGRGYDPAALLGDKGVSGAFEVRYGPLQLHPKVIAAPYAFFDAGYVANNNTAITGLYKSRTLTSVGAGVVFRLFNRANFEVTYAHPLDSVRTNGPRAGDRVLVQLTASLL